jgi:hypothetical protein
MLIWTALAIYTWDLRVRLRHRAPVDVGEKSVLRPGTTDERDLY